jgi:hypothetical protein
MSTATIETTPPAETDRGTARRTTPAPRPHTADATRPKLVETRVHAETAVTDIVTAATDALRTLLPSALVRPTEAVEYTFDLAEQLLAGSRRVCFELALILESGLDGPHRHAS